MASHKRHGKRPKSTPNTYVRTALTVALVAFVAFVMMQRGVRRSTNVTLVKRDRSTDSPRYSEADLFKLEALLAAQPDNKDIPKAIRALKIDLFQEWLHANGNDAIRMDVRSIDHKGVYATKPLRAGRPVVRVPFERLLTTDAILRTDIGARLAPLKPSVHVIVGTYIALQRRNASFEMRPYLRILPEKMDFMPTLVKVAAIDSLNGTSAEEIVVQRKSEIDDEWTRVSPAFPYLPVEDFHWGVLISMTRTSAIVINGVKTSGLVPLLNEIRHAPSAMATTSAKITNGYYVLSTTKAIQAGGELTRYYGARSAQMFYCDYADVPKVITTADSIRLRVLPVQYAAPEIEDVIGNWPRNFLLTSDVSSTSMRLCLSFLRLRVATESEWAKAKSMTDDLWQIPFIDEENEKRAIAELASTIGSMAASLNCSAPDHIPTNASSSFRFAVDQARRMCSIEKQLAQIILDSIPKLRDEPKTLPTRAEWKESSDAFVNAKEWLVNGGADLSAVDIVAFGDSYRGLVAKHDVAKKEPVMIVPLSHCITSIAARRTALAQEAVRNNVTLTPHAMMAVLLIEESRRPESHHRRYLDTLPAAYDNFLIYYSEEELAYLKGTRVLSQFQPFITEIAEDFKLVQQAAPIASASLKFEEYRRARHAVDSRNFILKPGNDAPKEHILVPYADMMNHGLAANTEWRFDPHNGAFYVTASEPIAKGQALVTSYGDKSNAQLLVGYGFALPDNPFDKTTLRLNKESMCVVQRTFNTIDIADCFLKLRKRFDSEVELLRKMKEGAISGLARFKESIEEDQALAEKLLKQPDTGNDRIRFCVLARLGEKLVLKFWMEATDTLLQYHAGRIARDQLDPMYERYFKVLESPEEHGSKARGKPGSENAETGPENAET